ncbi:hypothetical protein LWI28_028922 [Acer negundo]|uniref:Integrase catalytic domain-containing protein n=1 Tax=Acer negundo TaxID=4023 RepID=A0AAD5ICC9_ACENE|nr:hypothetical protein LWI28_028922 [Acer negundo]
MYADDEAGLLALSGAEWHVWDRIKKAMQFDARTVEILKKLEDHEGGVERFSYKNGLLYYKNYVFVLGVPGLREEILAHFHSSKKGGHSGWLRTYVRIKHFFYWEGLKNEVKKLVAKCDICQKVKYDQRRPIGLLQPLSIPEKIWEDLTMDFVEGLPSSGGYESILVVVDRLSKGTHFIPLRHPFTVSNVAKGFVDNVVKLHWIPRSIVTNRGKLFMSSFWQELFTLQGSKLKASSSYHPQTDGQTEVVNRTLEQYLRCYCHEEQKRWKEYISWAKYWYNTSHHASINMSPFELMYRRPPPMLSTYEKGTTRNEKVERELIARDEVVAKKSLKKKFNVKLSQRYYGPFKVLERIGEVAYKLELPSTSRLHPVFHVTVLKKRVGNSSPISSDLPAFDIEGNLLIRPIIALRYRNWKKGRGMTKVWQVLVQWQGVPTEEATWEDYDEMVERFPDFSLEDKGILEERGNVETVRKSKTIMEWRSRPYIDGSSLVTRGTI